MNEMMGKILVSVCFYSRVLVRWWSVSKLVNGCTCRNGVCCCEEQAEMQHDKQ